MNRRLLLPDEKRVIGPGRDEPMESPISKPDGMEVVMADTWFQLCPQAGNLNSSINWTAPEPGVYLLSITATKLPGHPTERPA